jgi:hypothetical protein
MNDNSGRPDTHSSGTHLGPTDAIDPPLRNGADEEGNIRLIANKIGNWKKKSFDCIL